MTKDPVCGMTLSEDNALFTSEHEGETYWFCGAGCKERFDRNPDRFLNGEKVDWIEE